MKFSLLQNDKSTAKDELLLALFIIGCILIGILIFVWAPGFWIISKRMVKTLGVLWIMLGVIFIPALIYRLMTNDKKEEEY